MPLEHGTPNLPKMVDGKTNLDERYFNLVHGRVDQRLGALEELRISWESATDTLTRQGLTRIDEVLAPAFQKIEQVLELGFMTASSSTSQTLVLNDELVFIIEEGARRDLFQPTAFLAITRVATVEDYALARLLSYNSTTGALTVEIISVAGDPGPHTDWEIGGLAAATVAQQATFETVEAFAGQVTADKAAVAGDRATTVTAKNTAVSAAESAEASKVAAAASAAAATSAVLVNKPTDPSRPLKVRTIAEWADALGVMSDTTNQGITDAVVEAVATGRRVFVPAGEYNITSQIEVTGLTKPLRLELDPRAHLIAGASLRSSILRVNNAFQVIEIEGGVWDGSQQPEADLGLGESWGLLYVTNAMGGGMTRGLFKAADDYRNPLSDSAVFITGEDFELSRNRVIGFKDSSFYLSGGSSGTGTTGLKVVRNDFYGCGSAVIVKRYGDATIVSENTFRKCKHGISSGSASSNIGTISGGRQIIATGNQMDDVTVPFYLEWADGSVIANNRIRGWSVDLDGNIFGSTARGAIRLVGTVGARVKDNSITNTLSVNDTAMHGIILQSGVVDGVTRESTYNTVSDNDIDAGANSAGRALYEANAGNYNHFQDNMVFGSWASNEIIVGANTMLEKRASNGRKSVRFANREALVVDVDHVDVRPSTSGRFRTIRNGVDDERTEIFDDGSGHHVRGRSLGSAAKGMLWECNHDGGLTGGSIFHAWVLQGAEKHRITSTRVSSDISLYPNYADDTAAAAGGIAVGEWYRTGSVLKVRVA